MRNFCSPAYNKTATYRLALQFYKLAEIIIQIIKYDEQISRDLFSYRNTLRTCRPLGENITQVIKIAYYFLCFNKMAT